MGRTQIRSSVGEMKEDVGIGKSSCSGGGEREKRWGGGCRESGHLYMCVKGRRG